MHIRTETSAHPLPDGEVRLLGAVHTVTGAMTRVETADAKLLVDCGLAQGRDARDWSFPDDALDADAVVLISARGERSVALVLVEESLGLVEQQDAEAIRPQRIEDTARHVEAIFFNASRTRRDARLRVFPLGLGRSSSTRWSTAQRLGLTSASWHGLSAVPSSAGGPSGCATASATHGTETPSASCLIAQPAAAFCWPGSCWSRKPSSPSSRAP
jgi:hypothetical protein